MNSTSSAIVLVKPGLGSSKRHTGKGWREVS